MAIPENLQKTFKLGTSIELIATFKDFDDNLVDPTTVTARIRNEDFEVVATLTPVRESLGVYKAYHTFEIDDYSTEILNITEQYLEFTYEWEGTVAGLKSLERKKIYIILAD